MEDNDDECFLGAVDVSDMAALQRDDPQLRGLIKNLEGQESTVLHVFIRTLPTFSIREGALYNKKLQ